MTIIKALRHGSPLCPTEALARHMTDLPIADWQPTPTQRANSELTEFAIRLGAGTATQRPVRVYMQLASACNLGCYMCTEYNRPEGARHGVGLVSMSEEIISRLERDVFPYSSHVQLGVGGEPTFSENFVATVDRSLAANQHVTLITNGTFLERDAIARCVADQVHFTQVSIDAATPATYERIRLGSRWSRLMAGIEKLQALRAQSQRPSRLQFNYVLMRSNIEELVQFIDLAAELGADTVHGQHVNAVTEPSQGEPLVYDKELYDRIRLRAIARAEERGVTLLLPDGFGPSTPSAVPVPVPVADAPTEVDAPHLTAREADVPVGVPCREPYQAIVVLYDGNVYACCHPLAHSKMKLGNILEQPFEEIWNGTLFRSLRRGMPCGDVPVICRECPMVHNPPPSAVDDAFIERSETLAEYYSEGERVDPSPFDATLAYMADLRGHATALEGELEGRRVEP